MTFVTSLLGIVGRHRRGDPMNHPGDSNSSRTVLLASSLSSTHPTTTTSSSRTTMAALSILVVVASSSSALWWWIRTNRCEKHSDHDSTTTTTETTGWWRWRWWSTTATSLSPYRAPTTEITNHGSENDDYNDAVYLQQAHQLRLALAPPRQSQFRVVALVVLEEQHRQRQRQRQGAADVGTPQQQRQQQSEGNRSTIVVIPGTNDEPGPYIGGAICAERAAFLQVRLFLQQQQQQQSRSSNSSPPPPPQWFCRRIYIVTDAQVPIPPGLLCREYMYGFVQQKSTTTSRTGHDDPPANDYYYYYSLLSPDDDTIFVLQSSDPTTTPWKVTLRELYPHPPPNMGQLPPPSFSGGSTPQQQDGTNDDGEAWKKDIHNQLVWTDAKNVGWKRQLQELWRSQQEQQKHKENSNTNSTLTTSLKIVNNTDDSTTTGGEWWQRLLQSAQAAAQLDDKDDVHARRHGAAVAVLWKEDNEGINSDPNSNNKDNITILTASQCKALEYGATLDAVSQLVPQLVTLLQQKQFLTKIDSIHSNANHHNHHQSTTTTTTGPSSRQVNLILALVQVDQDGIPHAPYAAARSLLVEHGLGHVPVVITTQQEMASSSSAAAAASSNSEHKEQQARAVFDKSVSFTTNGGWMVQVVPARELAPFVPEW